MLEKDKNSYLKLLRFSGEELYLIENATWYFQERENQNNELCLEIKCSSGIQLAEDTEVLNGKPHWELTIQMENLNKNSLNIGFKTEIENGYNEETGDYVTNFYYCDHEESNNNKIEILDKKDKQILFRLEGKITDVSYYDGSKPKNKIFVETWFNEDQ